MYLSKFSFGELLAGINFTIGTTGDGKNVPIPVDDRFNPSGPTNAIGSPRPQHGTGPIYPPQTSVPGRDSFSPYKPLPGSPAELPQSDRRWLTPDVFRPSSIVTTLSCLATCALLTALYLQSHGENSFARKGALATGALFLSGIGISNFA